MYNLLTVNPGNASIVDYYLRIIEGDGNARLNVSHVVVCFPRIKLYL